MTYVFVDPDDGKIAILNGDEELAEELDKWRGAESQPWYYTVDTPSFTIHLDELDNLDYIHELFSHLGYEKTVFEDVEQ